MSPIQSHVKRKIDHMTDQSESGVSPEPKPLRTKHLAATIAAVPQTTVQDRVRQRLRDEMQRRRLSQREISGLLGGVKNGWSQSRIAKLLTGRRTMGVDDLASLCFALDLSLTEVIRDHGMEFCAEMTPTELRVLERLRQLPKPIFEAVLALIDVRTHTRIEDRGATKPKDRLKKAR